MAVPVFYRFSSRACVVAIACSVTCTVLKGTWGMVLAPVGLPGLTLPFCTGAIMWLLVGWPTRVPVLEATLPEETSDGTLCAQSWCCMKRRRGASADGTLGSPAAVVPAAAAAVSDADTMTQRRNPRPGLAGFTYQNLRQSMRRLPLTAGLHTTAPYSTAPQSVLGDGSPVTSPVPRRWERYQNMRQSARYIPGPYTTAETTTAPAPPGEEATPARPRDGSQAGAAELAARAPLTAGTVHRRSQQRRDDTPEGSALAPPLEVVREVASKDEEEEEVGLDSAGVLA
jgi:hypothetical protein